MLRTGKHPITGKDITNADRINAKAMVYLLALEPFVGAWALAKYAQGLENGVTLKVHTKKNAQQTPTSENKGFVPPKVYRNEKGQLTNGTQTIDVLGMEKHLNGTKGKSQFLLSVDAEQAVLDASAFADKYDLWKPSSGNAADFADKAKVPVLDGYVGVTGKGEPTSYINLYRRKNGYVHGCLGNP